MFALNEVLETASVTGVLHTVCKTSLRGFVNCAPSNDNAYHIVLIKRHDVPQSSIPFPHARAGVLDDCEYQSRAACAPSTRQGEAQLAQAHLTDVCELVERHQRAEQAGGWGLTQPINWYDPTGFSGEWAEDGAAGRGYTVGDEIHVYGDRPDAGAYTGSLDYYGWGAYSGFHGVFSEAEFQFEDTSPTWETLFVNMNMVAIDVLTGGLSKGIGALGGFGRWIAKVLGLTDDVAKVGAKGGMPLARALEGGLVKSGGKLAQVLGGIEKGYRAAGPKNALEALGLVKNATSAAGLETGVATVSKTGEIVLQNVGGITTTLGTNGSILVQRGSDVLLHLLP